MTGWIVSDPDVLYRQARLRSTWIPVTVVLDCLTAGMSEDEIAGGYPSRPARSVQAALYPRRSARPRGDCSVGAISGLSSSSTRTSRCGSRRSGGIADHDVDTVVDEGLSGRTDPDVVAAAGREGCFVISPDRRARRHTDYPLGTHSGSRSPDWIATMLEA